MRKLAFLLPPLLACAMWAPRGVFADEKLHYLFPVAPVFSGPIGIVYPGTGSAGAINPTSLNDTGKSWGLYASNSIPISGAGDFGVSTSIVRTTKAFSLAGGYVGTVGAATTHGFFGGMAARIEKLTMGVSYLKSPLDDTNRIDAGISLPMVKNMDFTLKVEEILSGPRPVVGFGFQGEMAQMEMNFRLPPLQSMDGGYEIVGASTLLMGSYSLHSAVAYQTLLGSIAYTFGIGKWLESSIHLSFQYSSNSRLNVGLSLEL